MTRKQKRVISMGLTTFFVLILAGLYFWQQSQEEAEVEFVDPTPSTISLISRLEADMLSVEFERLTETHVERYTIHAIEDQNGLIEWVWHSFDGAFLVPNDYVLNPMLVRDKVRPAWLLAAPIQAFENANDVNTADLGFSPPVQTMTANYTDGTTLSIYLGEMSADMNHRFVMLSDRPGVYLLHAHLANQMMVELEHLIDRELPFFTVEAEYIKIAQQNRPVIEMGVMAMENEEVFAGLMPEVAGGVLTMLQPIENRQLHHPNLQARVLEPLELLTLGDVVAINPEDLTPFGLNEPTLEFIFRSAEGDAHLLFGNTTTHTINGESFNVIYVKFADRPHVFITNSWAVNALMDIRLFDIVDRFIGLIDIRDVYDITVVTNEEVYNKVLNHDHEENSIYPTLNNRPIEEAPFRTVYRNLISLSADAEINPAAPTEEPVITITFNRIQNPNNEWRFYNYDGNFFAVGVDNHYPWFVTNRRDVEFYLASLRDLENH